MKVLTNIRFVQTAGIAQVVLAFMDFIEKARGKKLSVVAVNITNDAPHGPQKTNGKKTSTISFGMKIPKIAKVAKKAKSIFDVEKKYKKIISAYQSAIRSEKPDLVLINGTYFMPWCLLLAAEKENVPVVLHYHGVLAKEVQNWGKKERKIFLDMERRFDRKDIFYIFPSQITKDAVEKEVFMHKIKKSAIIPNPVPSHFFAGKSAKEASGKTKNIGIVSRWTGIKNVRFCEQLADYNKKTGSKFVINIITDLKKGSPYYKKLSKIVKFHKPGSNKNLVSFYKKMGVVISPSHFETYGNVAKESLASGTPAIVSSNMGVSETFSNLGLCDWIIDFGSVKSVYDKIGGVIGQNVCSNVRKEIKKHYSSGKIFNKIISVLSSAA